MIFLSATINFREEGVMKSLHFRISDLPAKWQAWVLIFAKDVVARLIQERNAHVYQAEETRPTEERDPEAEGAGEYIPHF